MDELFQNYPLGAGLRIITCPQHLKYIQNLYELSYYNFSKFKTALRGDETVPNIPFYNPCYVDGTFSVGTMNWELLTEWFPTMPIV